MTELARKWRAEFPILESKTYLASHSLGAVPRATAGALRTYYEEWVALGIAAWDGPWWKAVLGFCADLEAVLHANGGTVVPMPNATRAMAAVASCLDYKGGRNKIVLTDLEFTTFYPLWQAQRRLGAEIHIVRSPDGISVPVETLVEAIDRRTAIVPTCHGYFRSGGLQDVAALARACRDAGAYSLIDGYQCVGTVPVDVRKLGVDFYVGGSHKWLCGGAGAAYLYVRPKTLPGLQPRLTGWFGLANPFAYQTDLTGESLHEGVFRFLDGTPNVPGIYAAREGIRTVLAAGIDAIRKNSWNLTEGVMAAADERGLRVRTPRERDRRTGMVCLDFEGAREACDALVRAGVVVDWRPDCGIRVSPHFYNTTEDLDRFFEVLDGVRKPRRGARARAVA